MALFFIMDKMEGFDDETQIDDSEYLEHRYREEHYNNLENLENFANNKIKQEIKNNKSPKIKSALKKSSNTIIRKEIYPFEFLFSRLFPPNPFGKIIRSPSITALISVTGECFDIKK